MIKIDENLQLILNNNPFPVILHDLNSVYFLNKAAKSYLTPEFSLNDLNRFYDLLNDSDRNAYVNVLKNNSIPCKLKIAAKIIENEITYFEINIERFHIQGLDIFASYFNDITNRVNYEAEIKASENKYKELYSLMRMMCDNVPDLIWAKDKEKKYLFANKAICNYLLNAVDTNEPLGKNDLFFAHRERESMPNNPDWHTFGEICADSDSIVLETLQPERFEEWGNVKGEFLFLDVFKAPFKNDSGDIIGTVGCGRDVTHQKQVEKMQKESEQSLNLEKEKFKTLFENSPVGIVLTNDQGDVLIINDEYWKIIGGENANSEERERIRISINVLTLDTFKSAGLCDNFYQLFENSIPFTKEVTLRTVFNLVKHINFVAAPILDEFGKVKGAIINALDITNQKNAEIALKASEEKYRFIAQKVHDVIWRYSLTLHKFTYVNEAIEDLTGYTPDEAMEVSVFDFVHPDFIEYLDNDLLNRINYYKVNKTEDLVKKYEILCYMKNHELKWLEIKTGLIFDDSGNILEIIGITRDIHDKKNSEFMIEKHLNELKEINATKDKFFSIISHDLRSPFIGFLGLTDMLIKDFNDMSLNDLNEILLGLNQSANNLYKLLNNLLQWSEIQKGDIALNRKNINLNEFIKESIKTLKAQAISKKIKILFNPKEEIVANLDPNILDTIIRNLITNAIKYSFQNSKIKIETSRNDNSLRISIKDYGLGIAKENIEKIFKIDEKYSTLGSNGEVGSGLGLILCREFAHKMNGEIACNSKLGAGSTFIVEFKNIF